MLDQPDKPVVVIGAGPAGMTAAYELTKYHHRPVVVEQLDKVGGIARTETYKGFYFDMGGHRFYSKADAAKKMWREILGEDFLLRPRLSRIYYNHRFFQYPLQPMNALFGLGIWQSILIALSYVRWQFLPYRREDTFEQWVTNRFGRRLFEIFFKTYTEKVWGIACSALKAEWAAQRIKDLSLKSALLAMFLTPKTSIKSLISEFHYPRLGPGMMWNAVKSEVERRGGLVQLNSEVIRICLSGNRIESVIVADRQSGKEATIHGAHFISSMPISEFAKRLDPAPPEVVASAEKLTYRDLLTVCLIVNQPDLFPDNWIYVHSPGVKVGRIQNFKNWSPDMVPDSSKTSLGLEYFCTEGDEIWNMSDADLVELGKREMAVTGLAAYNDIEDGCVFRVPKAYPIYDSDYHTYVEIVKDYVNGLVNFQTIGRNGLHRYDNQDHAMVTGMLAVRNLVLGEKNDIWSVNTDGEYLEEIKSKGVGERHEPAGVQEAFARVLAKLDPLAFGLAVAITAGLCLFLATLILVIRGEPAAAAILQLLDQFFPGYSVTFIGSFIGLFYASAVGFIGGWGFAYLRNAAVFIGAAIIHRDIEWRLIWDLLDEM